MQYNVNIFVGYLKRINFRILENKLKNRYENVG